MLAAALATALAAAACGSSGPPRLDTTKIARAIEQTIQAQNGLATNVTCPAPPLVKVGLTFRCVAKLAVGAYAVDVVEISSKGAVRYSSTAPLEVLDSVTVEHAIAASIHHQRHLVASVSCPAPVLQRAGLAFECHATTKRGADRFAVTEIDADGHVRIVDQTTHLTSTHTTTTKTATTRHRHTTTSHTTTTHTAHTTHTTSTHRTHTSSTHTTHTTTTHTTTSHTTHTTSTHAGSHTTTTSTSTSSHHHTAAKG